MQPYGRTPTTSDCKGLIQRWYLIKGNISMAQVPIPSQLLSANPHFCTGSQWLHQMSPVCLAFRRLVYFNLTKYSIQLTVIIFPFHLFYSNSQQFLESCSYREETTCN